MEEGGYRVWASSMRAGGSELRELELDASNRGSAVATEIDSMALIVGRTSVEKGGFEVSARHVDPETAVEQPVAAVSPVFRLGAGYPNPFNAAVRIPFSGGCRGAEGLLVQRRGPAPRGADAAVRLGRDSLGRPRRRRTAGCERSLLDRRAAEVGHGRPRHLACAPHRGDAHQIGRGPASGMPPAPAPLRGSLPAGTTPEQSHLSRQLESRSPVSGCTSPGASSRQGP